MQITVITCSRLSRAERQEIIALCSRAFDEDLAELFETFPDATHVLGRLGSRLVSHAAWVTRWLQVGSSPPMRTAYVEAVATDQPYRNRGYASSLMNRLGREIVAYDLGGLSPSEPGFYERLGWELWQGPLFIRKGGALLPSPPDEQAMILRLPRTPTLELTAPLSAEWRAGELW
jgi:aminoglycoside 2'-N-acetyltransferase I